MDKLQSQAGSGRKVSTPQGTQSNQAPYAPPPAYRYNYRYNMSPAPTQQIQSAAPPPTFQAPSVPTMPQVPQTPQAASLLASAAPMTWGNLFYGYRGYPQTPSRGRGGSPVKRARMAAQYATIPHHPDSDAGRQAYAQQVQEWHSQYGTDAIPNSQRPYPLKPGTSPIGSRECFNCGMVTTPSHQSYECTNTPLPTQETKWHETVSCLVSRTLASTPSTSMPTNIQFVTSAAGPLTNVQYAAAAAPVVYPQYAYYPEPYEMYDAAGNEYGPQ